MKKILTTTALVLAMAFSNAHAATPAVAQPSSIDSALLKLPKKDANSFRDTMAEAHEKNKDLYEEIHQVHEDLRGILTAKDFDEDAFLEKSRELRKLHDKIGNNIDSSFADAIDNLPAKERLKFADALQDQHEEHVATTQPQ